MHAGASLTVTGGTFNENTGSGGGLYIEAQGSSTQTAVIQVTDTHFIENVQGGTADGGGMFADLADYSSLVIDQTLFHHNVINAGYGGGLHLVASGANATATIDRSEFINQNTANLGGGVYVTTDQGAAVSILRSLFRGNSASAGTAKQGGGITDDKVLSLAA